MIHSFPEEQAKKILENMYDYATILLNNPHKIKRFRALLNKEKHPEIAEFRSLFIDYTDKKYTETDFETIMKVTAALIYFIMPQDLIPDMEDGIGYLDDDAVIQVCKKLVQDQLDLYRIWKQKKN